VAILLIPSCLPRLSHHVHVRHACLYCVPVGLGVAMNGENQQLLTDELIEFEE
jgi:hypothetical protein